MRLRLLEQESVLLQREENTLRNFEMILAVRGGIQIIRNTDLLEQINETFVIRFIHFLDRLTEFIRAHGDGCAVRVCAGDHQHLVSFKAVITRGDVPGQV